LTLTTLAKINYLYINDKEGTKDPTHFFEPGSPGAPVTLLRYWLSLRNQVRNFA